MIKVEPEIWTDLLDRVLYLEETHETKGYPAPMMREQSATPTYSEVAYTVTKKALLEALGIPVPDGEVTILVTASTDHVKVTITKGKKASLYG